jgi:predicted ABC-type ATPase
MFFITLPNVETAIERVRERVSKGGHSVDTNTIQERFDAGLQQLDNTFASFDYLRIFESSHRSLSTNAIIDMKAPGLEIRKPFSNSTAGKIPKLVAYIEQQSGNL